MDENTRGRIFQIAIVLLRLVFSDIAQQVLILFLVVVFISPKCHVITQRQYWLLQCHKDTISNRSRTPCTSNAERIILFLNPYIIHNRNIQVYVQKSSIFFTHHLLFHKKSMSASWRPRTVIQMLCPCK